MHRARRLLEHADIHYLLRSHLDETIEWPEIKERDNLDELLAGLSVLHISGLDRDFDLARLGLDREEVRRLLDHDAVARYFEAYYPYAPPILFRENGRDRDLEIYLHEATCERFTDGWGSAFQQFLVLDAAFNAPGPLNDFLAVMDSFTIHGLDLDDLERAFRNEDRMRRLLKRKAGRTLLGGVQDFFEFSEELDDALGSWERFPWFAGLVWLNYGYWYGAGGERMREVAAWVADTIQAVAARELDDGSRRQRAGQLEGVMDRLTDLEGYPRKVLRACARPLERWRRHVEPSAPGRLFP